ncbi:MAG: hypothetical protein ACRDPA_27505 [Solirubrobacteraceae bacterium]
MAASDRPEAVRGVKRDRLQSRLDAIVTAQAAAYRTEPQSPPIHVETVAAELEVDHRRQSDR